MQLKARVIFNLKPLLILSGSIKKWIESQRNQYHRQKLERLVKKIKKFTKGYQKILQKLIQGNEDMLASIEEIKCLLRQIERKVK